LTKGFDMLQLHLHNQVLWLQKVGVFDTTLPKPFKLHKLGKCVNHTNQTTILPFYNLVIGPKIQWTLVQFGELFHENVEWHHDFCWVLWTTSWLCIGVGFGHKTLSQTWLND
jgi:hypothetical protein